ncbi:MAG: exonuclease domain-containing protein [Thermoleophilia bacterium]|nr:exonuclease domain-containing protein [Thermoleophilia bacterium]
MQLQLSLKVADRLHEMLMVRGEPLEVQEAVRVLLACPHAPEELCVEIVRALALHDRRFFWDPNRRRHLFLRAWEVPDPELHEVPFVALDLETTGSRPGVSKITEIGAVRIEGLKEVARFNTLVNPMRPIPPMITRITGITQEMVADAPRIEEVLPEFLEFLQGAVVVAHNAAFDVGFLNYELARLKGRKLGEGAIDTLPLSRVLLPGLPNYRLHTLAEALSAPVAACHRALADALAVQHVFVHLANLLRDQGINRLEEVRALVNPASRIAARKLPLTRHLPRKPGVYRLVGKDGAVLFVGKADSLAEKVRSHFVNANSLSRGMRQAIQAVEHIAWEEVLTPLEALVKEHLQILEHRPIFNSHGFHPENYVYLKVGRGHHGLTLGLTRRPPKFLAGPSEEPQRSSGAVFLGPFRSRTKLRAAIRLLQELYPLRRCSRRARTCPCGRGMQSACLAPCTGDPGAKNEHDRLVLAVLAWLAGSLETELPDPLERSQQLMDRLTKEKRRKEAEDVASAVEHLLSIRRSYLSLLEANELHFVSLWPLDGTPGQAQIRVNIVWGGVLRESLSLTARAFDTESESLLARIWESCPPRLSAAKSRFSSNKLPGEHSYLPLVAVPQAELDLMLATRRWAYECSTAVTLPLPAPDANREERAAFSREMARRARSLLA